MRKEKDNSIGVKYAVLSVKGVELKLTREEMHRLYSELGSWFYKGYWYYPTTTWISHTPSNPNFTYTTCGTGQDLVSGTEAVAV